MASNMVLSSINALANAPIYESPAPVVSTALTLCGLTSKTPSLLTSNEPFSPKVTMTFLQP